LRIAHAIENTIQSWPAGLRPETASD
jgi:hypothetical protein